MRSETRNRPAAYPPRVSEATRPFWKGLREERFSTTRCDDCGDMTFPPKVVCPNCLSERLSWRPLSGRGTLYSYTRVASRLLGDHASPEVGALVSVVFLHYEDVTLFCFELYEG